MSGAPTMRSIEAGHRTLLGKRCPLRAGLLSSPLSPFPHITIKCIKPVLLLLVAASLVACSATLPITYAPSNLSRGSGSIAVEQFIYAAARSGKFPANQPEERGIGAIYLSEDIASLFTDAVRKELQFSGHTLDRGASLTIGGVIDR